MAFVKCFDYDKLYNKYDNVIKKQAEKHGHSCVYCLYRKNELTYIGKSINIFARLVGHIDSKKKFDKVKILFVDGYSNMHLLETYLICLHKPKLNKQYVEKDPLSIKIRYNKYVRKSIILN